MALEPKNIPLKGLFPLPDELADAPTQARATFWRLIGTEALRLKRLEILSGIDRWGNKFLPVKRKWGDPTPLIPHGKDSRTYRLLSLNSSAQGATLFWKSEGGRVSWPTILGYHAYKHGPRSLPVRDELGLTQKSVKQLMAQADIWKAGYEAGLEWASKHPKDLRIGKPRIPPPERFPTSKAAYERQLKAKLAEKPKVVLPPAEPKPGPKPRPKPQPKPKPAAEVLKETKAQYRKSKAEADRLAKEAADEARAIMDDARLKAIRERQAKQTRTGERKQQPAEKKAEVVEQPRASVTVGQFHGMTGEKTFHSVKIEGTNFHYEEGLGEVVAETLRGLAKAAKLPDVLTSKTQDIYFTRDANKADVYWKQRYNNPDHVSSATGSDGKIVIYNGKSLSAKSVVHEMGHNLASSIYGRTRPSPGSKYQEAMDSEEQPVSAYARNSPAEDFAESVKYYFFAREDFEKAHPKRFAVIDALMKGEDYEG